MSLISDILAKISDTGVTDTLKAPNYSAFNSALSAFLTQARGYFSNAYLKGYAFSQSFQLAPEFISDDVISGILPQDDIFSQPADTAGTRAFYDCLNDYFDSQSYEWTYGVETWDVVDIWANGVLFRLARTQNGSSPFYWVVQNDGYRVFVRRTGYPYPPFEGYNISINNIATAYNGKRYSIWDVISSISENAALSSALQDITNAILQVEDDTAALTTVVAGLITNSWQSVKLLAGQVRTAWSSGGAYGAAMVIINYFRTGSSAELDEDGSLIFVDNAALAPVVYTSGLTNFIASTVSALVAGIAASFSRVFAIVSGIVSTLVMALVQKLNYDYTVETNAGLVDSIKTGYPLAPHGLCATRETVSVAVLNNNKYAAGTGIWAYFVPGGVVISTLSEDGSANHQFHPDLIDRRSVIMDNYVHLQDNPTPDPIISGWYASSNVSWITFPETSQLLSTINSSESVQLSMSNDPSTGVLSEANSNIMADILLCNCFAYWLWVCSFMGARTLYLKSGSMCNWNATAGYESDWIVIDNNPSAYSALHSEYYDAFVRCLQISNLLLKKAETYPVGKSSNKWVILADLGTNTSAYPDDTYSVVRIHFSNEDWLFPVGQNLGIITSLSNFWGSPYQMPYNNVWALQTPKYDRTTFMSSVIGACVATAAVSAIIGIASIAIAKGIHVARLKSAAATESAWTAMTENPTTENALAYRRAARKNNFFARVFGGTIYNTDNFWGSSDDSSGLSLSSIGAEISQRSNTIDNETENLTTLVKLIKG